MAGLTEAEIDAYLAPLAAFQVDSIRRIRGWIFERCPDLREEIDEGKWFGGLLTYNSPEVGFVYALGPRKGGATTLHMMPYYSSKTLQERHAEAFKKVLTGKSCIQFSRDEQIPEEAIKDVFDYTGTYVEEAKVFFEARAKKKR